MTEQNINNADTRNDKRYRVQAGAFLGLVGGVSAIYGFSRTLGKVKKHEAKVLEKAGPNAMVLLDEGSMLALRALGWGTLYAVLGTGAFCYGVWKLSGAKSMEDFRFKMGSGLPRLTSEELPNSRTDFDGLTDLMKYLAAWGKE